MCAAPSDLTNIAQIRIAALKLFAERGYAGTSIRAVALEAGVSPSLVIHHFSTKANLKNAVDHWTELRVRQLLEELSESGTEQGEGMQTLWDQVLENPELIAYVRRMLLDGGESARTLFTGLLQATVEGMSDLEARGVVMPSNDPMLRALFLLVNDLGLVLLRDLVGDVIGHDPFSESGAAVWNRISMETYTNGVFTKADQRKVD